MTLKQRSRVDRVARERVARRSPWAGIAAALLLLIARPSAPLAQAQRPGAGDSARAARPFSRTLARIEFTGLTRTPEARARQATGLALPTEASPEAIQAAAERLRESRLFREVEVHTKPGETFGDVVLVFDVHENRPGLNFGLGYEDFSSWYLIPAQITADNLTGHGEQLSLGAHVGYRTRGLDLALRVPSLASPRDFWEVRLRGEDVDRIYFLDSAETKQGLTRGQSTLRLGRGLSPTLALESWLSLESIRVDSNASVYTDRAASGRRAGDPVPFASLPASIQRDVRDREQRRLGLSLVLDRRAGSGLATRGVWARVSGEGVFSDVGDFGSWQADLRGYVPITAEAQLAVRLRGASLSHQAPFFERYSVGGLYTVRGYPSQSLSPPEGHLNLGTGSIELRHAWWGPVSNPRFAGVAFIDGGSGWSRGTPSARDFSYGAGFGFRARVPWLGHLGLDIAKPLSPSPVNESFHVNGSIGWTF